MKPFSSPSIKYIIVPNIIDKIKTANKKTAIFARLAFKDLIKKLDSPINLVNLRILKTLKSLSALSAANDPLLTKKKLKYWGKIDSRSIIP